MTYYLNGPLPLMTACLAMVSMVTMGFLELRTLMIPNKSSLGVSPDTKISNWFDNGTQFLDLLTLYTHKYIKKDIHTHIPYNIIFITRKIFIKKILVDCPVQVVRYIGSKFRVEWGKTIRVLSGKMLNFGYCSEFFQLVLFEHLIRFFAIKLARQGKKMLVFLSF